MRDETPEEAFERSLFEELTALLPQAIAQAKEGKPALLRLLVRSRRQVRRQPTRDQLLQRRAHDDIELSQEIARQAKEWRNPEPESGLDT